MRARVLFVIATLCTFISLALMVQAQQNSPDSPSPSAQMQNNDPVVEGTVVSTSRQTLVVRSDDNQYHLFTYDNDSVRNQQAQPGTRVRVNGTVPNGGAQVAENVAILDPSGDSGNSATSSTANGTARGSGNSDQRMAQPPPQVRDVSNRMEGEARRWHAGGRIGVGFSPELFLFGVQSQIGPIFSPRFLFRPNTDFAFGELTDMVAVNLEGAYRFNTTFRHGWTPYVGFGPSLNFIHQGLNHRDVNFGNFDYKTGFNVLVGGQKHGTFAEIKTSLWSGPVPVLRLIVGYNF